MTLDEAITSLRQSLTNGERNNFYSAPVRAEALRVVLVEIEKVIKR